MRLASLVPPTPPVGYPSALTALRWTVCGGNATRRSAYVLRLLPKRSHGGGSLAASLQFDSFVNSLEDSLLDPHYVDERASLRRVCHVQSWRFR